MGRGGAVEGMHVRDRNTRREVGEGCKPRRSRQSQRVQGKVECAKSASARGAESPSQHCASLLLVRGSQIK